MDFLRRIKAKVNSSNSFNDSDSRKLKGKYSRKKYDPKSTVNGFDDLSFATSTSDRLQGCSSSNQDFASSKTSADSGNFRSTKSLENIKEASLFSHSDVDNPVSSKTLKVKKHRPMSWTTNKKKHNQPSNLGSIEGTSHKSTYLSYDQCDSNDMIIHGVFDTPGSEHPFGMQGNAHKNDISSSKIRNIKTDFHNYSNAKLQTDKSVPHKIVADLQVIDNNNHHRDLNDVNLVLSTVEGESFANRDFFDGYSTNDCQQAAKTEMEDDEKQQEAGMAEFQQVLSSIDKVLDNESIVSEDVVPKLRLGSLHSIDNVDEELLLSQRDDKSLLSSDENFNSMPNMHAEFGKLDHFESERLGEYFYNREIMQGSGEALASNDFAEFSDQDQSCSVFSGSLPSFLEDKHILDWGAKDVIIWCKEQKFALLAELFEGSDIDGACLLQINEQDLVNLGISDNGRRQQIINAVEDLKQASEIGVFEGGEEAYASATRSMLEMNTSTEVDMEIEKIWNKIEAPLTSNVEIIHEVDELEEFDASDDIDNANLSRKVDELDKNIVKTQETIDDMNMSIQRNRSKSQENLFTASRVNYAELEYKLANAESLLLNLQQQKAAIMADMKRSQLNLQNKPYKRNLYYKDNINSNLYGLIKNEAKEAIAVEITIPSKDHHGFLVTEDSMGGVEVTCAEDGISLRKGDRIVEVNGIAVPSASVAEFNDLLSYLEDPLRIVVLRALPASSKNVFDQEEQLSNLTHDLSVIMNDLTSALGENKELEHENEKYSKMIKKVEDQKIQLKLELSSTKEQLSLSDKKWRQLQDLLESLKGEDIDFDQLLDVDLDFKKDFEATTVAALEKNNKELVKLSNSSSVKNDISVPYELLNDNVPIWESLQNSSREQILQALKDHVIEHHRQKVFLNRLMGAVLKHSPGVLASTLDDFSYNDVKSKPLHMV